MSTNGRGLGPSIRTEGGLLPADLLARVAANDPEVPGLTLAAYHLDAGLRFGEAITRSWNRLIGAWAAFQAERAALPAGDPGTTITRERWLLPLFDELGYGRLQRATAIEITGKTYPVSHAWSAVPIHLIGCRVALDRRTERVAGAAGQAPHGLVQELLNRSPERLWGFVSNGLSLRILRDNATLTRQAYVEFDLEAIFDGEAYADFALLWLVAHQSRVEGENPEAYWLEQWTTFAAEAGTRALDKLRAGVETAITALGGGFLGHPANGELRDALRAGALDKQDYYRELLRLVYRLLFLFTAEDRGLLLDPGADEPTERRYLDYYSTGRLRHLAERRKGSRHADLWAGLRVVLTALGSDTGAPGLGLPALGGFLFSGDACPRLDPAELANRDLLDAVRALATIEDGRVSRSVDYRNLGAEELGGVYESLLELHPELDANAGTFSLTTAGGHERKTTGSYYTPTSLITVLLESALDPVLAEAAAQPDPAAAILRLAIVDPAAGSGHFLVAAAHRIAKRLAAVRTGEAEPSPVATRTALRDVIGHCIYAVDVNPMAVELCKVSLWLEAIEPGKPLNFLDAHIKCGNSLLGTTPELVTAGIPDAAFEALTGDDTAVARGWRTRNAQERDGQQALFAGAVDIPTQALAREVRTLDVLPEETLAAVATKAARHAAYFSSTDYLRARAAFDAWCAAFVAAKTPGEPEITTGVVRALGANPSAAPLPVRNLVEKAAADYAFFHWPLEFPAVLERGGFDVVVGNPPWDAILFREQEFFAETRPDIAQAATGAIRERLVSQLRLTDPELYQAYEVEQHRVEAIRRWAQDSGRYPLAGHGRTNTFALFAELALAITKGRVGQILPTGIVTDDSAKRLFQYLVEESRLVSLYDFENRALLFPAVDSRARFALVTIGPPGAAMKGTYAFLLHRVDEISDTERVISMSAADIALVSPNTRTAPTLRSKRDADLVFGCYRRFPILLNEGVGGESPWGVQTRPGLFNMTGDSHLFQSSAALEADGYRRVGNRYEADAARFAPLLEGKMFDFFDHRAASVVMSQTAAIRQGQSKSIKDAEHEDPSVEANPRYWVSEAEVRRRAGDWGHDWVLGWKEVTSATNERTLIAAILPLAGIGHKIPVILPRAEFAARTFLLGANLSTFIVDFLVRQRLSGTSLTPFTVKQLPLLAPGDYGVSLTWDVGVELADWIRRRFVELAYTANALKSLALDAGWSGAPFRWDPERRSMLRAELDAAYFHLYGLFRDDVEHVMGSFSIVRDRDEREFRAYRTKELILEAYDAMAIATRERPFVSRLVPGPGDPAAAHPPRPGEAAGQWIPWADVERAPGRGLVPTRERRPDRRESRPASVPPTLFPAQPAEPQVLYPQAAPAHRRAAESTAPAPAASPSQGTLADLARAAAASADWLPEEAVDAASVVPGRHVRHPRFGEGVIIEVRRTAKSPTVTIRFGVSGPVAECLSLSVTSEVAGHPRTSNPTRGPRAQGFRPQALRRSRDRDRLRPPRVRG